MKKTKTDEPSAATLRELPEIDFERYRVRRNPFAARISREGIEILHDGPSQRSLSEMPEADFSAARVQRNPYTSRAAEPAIQYGRGRPRAGQEIGPTPGRTLRLPESAWRALEVEAKDKRTTVHALLRELVMMHLEREAGRNRR
jgi:hypothetical protein